MSNRLLLTIVSIGIVLLIAIAGWFLWPRSTPLPTQNSTSSPFGPPAASVTSSASSEKLNTPDGFAVAFYTWYIANREQHGSSFPPDNLSSVLSPWLTTRFIANWQTIIDNTDADPVLWAQDTPAGWGPGISASITNQSGNSSSVTVSVGSGATTHVYALTLIKSNSSWLIDSIQGTL